MKGVSSNLQINDLIIKSLVIAFCLSIGIIIFYRPLTISNYRTVVSTGEVIPFQLVVRHKDQLPLLILYTNNPRSIDDWDAETRTRFVLDTARVAIGSQVNVIEINDDSTIAKVEYTNSFVFKNQTRNGFMLTRTLNITNVAL